MLTGRVDDLQAGKVAGWAFNFDDPGEHLLIKITLGSQTVASGVANILRPDLPEAGIGQGDHAFAIPLPPHIVSLAGLVFIAQSSRHGDAVLPVATNDERRLDDLVEILAARFETAFLGLREELAELKREVAALKDERAVAPALELDSIDARFAAFEERLKQDEVFILRLDELVKPLADRQRSARRGWFGRLRGSPAP